MTAPITPAQRAALYLARVDADPVLDPNFRRLVPALRRLAATEPALAVERLKDAAQLYLPGVPRTTPGAALARAVSIGTFWQHHLATAVKASFRTAEDYRRYMEVQSDPDALLASHLSVAPILIPADHSWLTEEDDIRGKSASQIVDDLALAADPPLVVFHFSVDDLATSGVLVRAPCSLDSVLGDHLQWRAGGLISGSREYLDGDIPVSAVSRLEWVS